MSTDETPTPPAPYPVHQMPPAPDLPPGVVAELVATHDAAHAVVAAVGPKHLTPKDMITGLRLIKKLGLIDTEEDDEQVLGVISGLAGDYARLQRLGRTTLSFEEWYTTSDAEASMDDDSVVEEDPTTPSDAS